MGPVGRRRTRNPFAKFHAAIAATKAGQSNTIVNAFGDSTSAGSGAGGPNGSYTNGRALAYPAALSALINANLVPSSAISVNGTNSRSPAEYALYSPLMTFTNAANWGGNGNTYGGVGFQTNVNDSRLIWSPGRNVDTFELSVACQGNTGTIAVYFDGSLTPTETFNSQTAGTALVKKTYTLPLGVHSIEIAKTAGTIIVVSQIVAYNSGVKEVLVMNGGAGGARVAAIAGNSSAYDSLPTGLSLNPALSIINAALNDLPGGTTQAAYEASLTSLVLAAKQTGDVLMVFPNSRGLVTQENAFFGYYQNVATATNTPVIDLRTVFGTLAEANAAGYMSGDNLHPSALGYQVIAQYIYDTITAGIS